MLTLTLAHDSWAAGSGELANMADATALLILGSAVASTTQDFGWNNVVRPALLQAWDDGVAARAAAAAVAPERRLSDAGAAEEGDNADELLPMVLHRPKRHLVETRLPNPNLNPSLHANSHPNPNLHPNPDPNLHRNPDPHQVEIRLPALPTYRILEPETVQITLPGATLRSGSEIALWPPLVIRSSPASPHVLLSFSSADCTGSGSEEVCTLTLP